MNIQKFAITFALATAAVTALPGCSTLPSEDCGTECDEDMRITDDVMTALRNDHPQIQLQDVRVQCERHVVYLYGAVDTELERTVVESAAAKIPGVANVINSLSVRGNGR